MTENILPIIFGLIGFIIFVVMCIRDSQTFKTIKLIDKQRADNLHHILSLLYYSNIDYYDSYKLENSENGLLLKKYIESSYYYGFDHKGILIALSSVISNDHRRRMEMVILNHNKFENRFKYVNDDTICDTIDYLCEKLIEYTEFYEQKSSYIDLAKKYKVNV